MDGEFAYYAARSGLTPPERYSLADHEFAYFSGVSGLPVDRSLADHKRAFYRTSLGGAPAYFDLADLEYAYMAAALGVTGQAQSFDDLKRQFVLIPAGPVELRRNFATDPTGSGTKWTETTGWATKSTQTASPPIAGMSYQRFTMNSALVFDTVTIELCPVGTGAWPIDPSSQYIVSTYMRLNAGSSTDRGITGYFAYDSAGVTVNNSSGSGNGAAAVGQWYRSQLTIPTVNASAAYLRALVRFFNTSMAIGDSLDVAAALVEKGTTLDTYFDGNFPSCQWTGPVNNSASILLG